MPQPHVVAEGLIGWQEDLADRSNDGRWDFECLLDDFIVLSFFAGNDFLPASPSIDICSGASPSIDICSGRHTVAVRCCCAPFASVEQR